MFSLYIGQRALQFDKKPLAKYTFKKVAKHQDGSSTCSLAQSHYMCSIAQENNSANGCAHSKKESKHIAASVFYKKFLTINTEVSIISFVLSHP